jgi:hypothetical protein
MVLQIVCGVNVNSERNVGCIKSSEGTMLATQNLMTLDDIQLVKLACHISDLEL